MKIEIELTDRALAYVERQHAASVKSRRGGRVVITEEHKATRTEWTLANEVERLLKTLAAAEPPA